MFRQSEAAHSYSWSSGALDCECGLPERKYWIGIEAAHSWRQRITWSWRSTKCKCGSVRRKFYLWDRGSSLLFVTSEYHVIVLLSLSQRGEVPLTFSLIGEIAVRFTQIVHKERSKTSHWQQVYYPDYKWTSLSDFEHVYYENEFTNQSDLFLDRKQRMLCFQLPDSTFSYLLL